MKNVTEKVRLGDPAWRTWGTYVSERQWGTVREDYSADGDAWRYLSHDAARSRAYRWGEDGIGGVSDLRQLLCFSWAFWNERDSIIKERLFGLTGQEGNHGEDVKEVYYYLDGTPTHSYMKMLYRYPQQAFPYDRLLTENTARTKTQPEFELEDTGIFADGRYFDLLIEFAKSAPNELLFKVTAFNRAAEAASLHVIPQLWFRNTWSWAADLPRPSLSGEASTVSVIHPEFNGYRLTFEGSPELLFCENDTNVTRLFSDTTKPGPFKDGVNDFIVMGDTSAISKSSRGTKVGLRFKQEIAAGGSASFRLRLGIENRSCDPELFDREMSDAIRYADEFYDDLQSEIAEREVKVVQRQSLAGMLWSKQFYHYNVAEWLDGDPAQPPPAPMRKEGRNSGWRHIVNSHIISMPDKWEYPWYAAWDLAFHCLPLALVDIEFAKSQLLMLTHEWYMHPNGQMPAYEWNFGDVNPPVHAWATWRVYSMEKKSCSGKGDRPFLERVFQKLLLNFTWWVNRKDEHSHNIFQGGFLGLDNIGVFDRSSVLPTGGHLEQADATAWVAMYSLNMMKIALELSRENPVYQDLATKFFEHFLQIAKAMVNIGGVGVQLWDEQDGFYYDVLHTGDHQYIPLRIRSLVGIIPLFAVETIEPELLDELPEFRKRLEWTLANRPDLATLVSRWQEPGKGERRLLSLVRGHRMKRILRRVLDETEFLSPYGIRALSKYYEKHPYVFDTAGGSFSVKYQPGESDSGMFGGNSNWRGPIWMPVNYLLIESLQKFHHYYGDDFKIEYPTGSGKLLTIAEVASKIVRRLASLFLPAEDGSHPAACACAGTVRDLHFPDLILFHEYFHGDTGRGLGASHQTGWTGLIAKLLMPKRPTRAQSPRPANKEH